MDFDGETRRWYCYSYYYSYHHRYVAGFSIPHVFLERGSFSVSTLLCYVVQIDTGNVSIMQWYGPSHFHVYLHMPRFS